ncbi:MAG TPA: UBP-type zinc finger domain-containing protein [Mycobacteriales bacterium]|jgi:Zn-finger in ubiquitin-hydrolases and other protein.
MTTVSWMVAGDATGQPASHGCTHLAMLPAQVPIRSVEGCAECLSEGGDWLHLRECVQCGHVGCCESSSGRHAVRHSQETGHPVIRSLQPGERWGWCQPDGLFLVYG